MPLNLYRRHLRIAGKCIGGHEPDSRNYEPEELRRGWRKCHCPIYICGTLKARFKRQNSHQTKWEDAKAFAAILEAADSWDGKKPVIVPTTAAPVADAGRMRISYAQAVRLAFADQAELRQWTKHGFCGKVTTTLAGWWWTSPMTSSAPCGLRDTSAQCIAVGAVFNQNR
jgi:hypothetical protein